MSPREAIAIVAADPADRRTNAERLRYLMMSANVSPHLFGTGGSEPLGIIAKVKTIKNVTGTAPESMPLLK